ncbi:MAG: response regulator [Gemmatimonas sp.]|nr:response regulator [Gemmatimonas sp.]
MSSEIGFAYTTRLRLGDSSGADLALSKLASIRFPHSTKRSFEVSTTTADPVTVFIAEDNPILLQGLERALTANGYAVDTAADGPAMMELLDAAPLPDILLLDVMMPGMSGVEVLDSVRADPRTAGLPVVLITAAADEVVPGSSLEGRGADVLMKPFRLNELLSRIENHVGRHRGAAGEASRSSGAAAGTISGDN